MPVAALAMRRLEGLLEKTFLILRHARPEPGAAGQEDHDRTLMERGLVDAAAMARYFKKQGYSAEPHSLLDQPAHVQTVEPVLAVAPAPVDYLASIYLAPPGKLIALVQDAADADKVLMLVGHNPGLEQCAAMLARASRSSRRKLHRHDVMEEKFHRPGGAGFRHREVEMAFAGHRQADRFRQAAGFVALLVIPGRTLRQQCEGKGTQAAEVSLSLSSLGARTLPLLVTAAHCAARRE